MTRNFILLITAAILSGCSEYTFRDYGYVMDHSFKSNDTDAVKASGRSILSPSSEDITEPNGLLTLRDAVSLTLMYNPELQAYSYEIRAAEARQVQAGLWRNPELDVEVENIGGSGPFSGFDSAETTIQLSQLISLNDKSGKRKNVYAYDSRLAESEYQAKRLEISNTLTKAFIRMLFIQEKKALCEELIQISQETFDSVEKRVQAGKDSPVDLLKARIGLAKARLQYLEATKYQDVIRNEIASFWNSQTPKFSWAAGRLDELHDLPSIDQVQELMQNNPELIQRAIEVQKRQAEIALAEAGSIPDITVAGGMKHFNDLDETAFIFGFSIPLSVSDRNQGARMEAVQNLRKAEELQKASVMSVWNRMNRLYADLSAAYARAVILRDEVRGASEQMFDASRISYEQGAIGYLELLDAQRVYFSSKNEYVDALAEYHMNKTELERLTGRNLQKITVSEKRGSHVENQ